LDVSPHISRYTTHCNKLKRSPNRDPTVHLSRTYICTIPCPCVNFTGLTKTLSHFNFDHTVRSTSTNTLLHSNCAHRDFTTTVPQPYCIHHGVMSVVSYAPGECTLKKSSVTIGCHIITSLAHLHKVFFAFNFSTFTQMMFWQTCMTPDSLLQNTPQRVYIKTWW